MGLGQHALAEGPTTPTSGPAGVKLVTTDEAKKLFDSGAVFIDTRIKQEFVEKTIKGAISVTYKEKSQKDAAFDGALDQFDLSKLPADKAKALVAFCNGPACWKGYKGAVTAAKAGYSKVYWYRTGVPDWIKSGNPTQ